MRDQWNMLEASKADPVGFVEPFAQAGDDELIVMVETFSRMAGRLREEGREEDAGWAIMIADMFSREQTNRNIIRNAAASWKELLPSLDAGSLLRNVESFDATVATLRDGRGYSEVMDPAARVSEACAELCRDEIRRRRLVVAEGNSPDNPS